MAESFEYDLLLLDVMLPKLDGISVCRQLRAEGCQVPILIGMSGADSDADGKGERIINFIKSSKNREFFEDLVKIFQFISKKDKDTFPLAKEKLS